ncbi:phosphotransferase KptA/Tpt1 [Chytriomyces sp. MP71]|nr:phosphotransferase KptA/Tpt1 [Chytriomyces sp. MP71]
MSSSASSLCSLSQPAKNQSRRGNLPPDVLFSKAVSKILRHDPKIPMRSDGFVRLDDLVKRPQFKNKTLADFQQLVSSNDKQRFSLAEVDGVWIIKANQGHSRQVNVALEEISDPSDIPIVIHGTYLHCWPAIQREGLNRMNRNHIHFAVGRPGESGVISGMRKTCEVLIFIDAQKAMFDGIRFFRSPNNVILSEGVNGVIASDYFKIVEMK